MGPMRDVVARGGVALGITSVVAVGLGVMPAGAQVEPTVVVECSSPNVLHAVISDFPANETLRFFALVEPDGFVVNSMSISTDDSGTGGTQSFGFTLPADIGFAVFRDTDGNFRWDPDRDETLYRGDGTVPSTCPPATTLNPK